MAEKTTDNAAAAVGGAGAPPTPAPAAPAAAATPAAADGGLAALMGGLTVSDDAAGPTLAITAVAADVPAAAAAVAPPPAAPGKTGDVFVVHGDVPMLKGIVKHTKSPLAWMGSKNKAIKQVMARFPPVMNNYMEPFVGGGTILLSLLAQIKAGTVVVKGTI